MSNLPACKRAVHEFVWLSLNKIKPRDMWVSRFSFASQIMGWQNSPIVFGNDANQCTIKDHHSIRCECQERPRVVTLKILRVLCRIRTTKRSCRILIMYSLSYRLQFELDRFLRLLKMWEKYLTAGRLRGRQSTQKNPLCPSQITNKSLVLWAERKPSVMHAIYTARQDRLAVLNRHILVWIAWFFFIP